MKEFIVTNFVSILIVLIFALLCMLLYASGKKKTVYKMLSTLIDEAEKTHGGGTGKLKFAEVMKRCYAALPPIIKLFITYGTLERWIENALKEAKARWESE